MFNWQAFWQDDVAGGGGPVDQFYIAWDADQITGDVGKFTVEMPIGSPGSATGSWADSDATALEPVDEIYFTLSDRRIEVSGHSSFADIAGTWNLGHSDFRLTDDAKTMTAIITDFNGTQATSSVLFLLRHQDPLQSVDIPAPTKHPNFRSPATDLHWEFTTQLSTPKPSWYVDDPDTQAELTTTGYGGHVKVGYSQIGPTCKLVASTENGYAGMACEPRFSVAVPPGKTIWFERTKIFADGVTPVDVELYEFEGEINWTGRSDELNIFLPKVNLADGDTLLIKLWVTGLNDIFDTTEYALWQYSDHHIVSQGAEAMFTDPMGIFVDPVGGDDNLAEFGNSSRPYRSYLAFARDAVQATFPTGTAENPINVYQPRGTVAEWADGVQQGDQCVLKENTFHLQPWPGTSGQAPVIDGRKTKPAITNFVSTPQDENKYGVGQVGLINLRDCNDSIVEEFIVRDSRHCGIVAERDQRRDFIATSTCDGNIIRNCIVDRSGSDGVLVRGAKYSKAGDESNPVWQPADEFSNYPATNTHIENITIIEANWGLESAADVGVATGQALTISTCVNATVINCSATNYRKEGFDVISSRNVSFIDCYAMRDPASEYGGSRGTAFYNDSQAEGSRDILFDRCTCEGDATGFVLGSERGGECTRIVFRNMSITGVNTGFTIPGPIDAEVATYTDCKIEHCSVVAGSGFYAMRVTTLGDPVGVAIDNCIFSGDRSDLLNKTTANWPTFGNNVVWSTNPAGHTGAEPGTMIEVDPQFTSATDLTPQNAAVLGQITPPIRTVNIENVAVSDPDNYGAY